jgi:hypothetical protein
LPLFTVLLLSCASLSHAAFGFKLDGTLDKDAISFAYFEGEFSRVLPPLENYRLNFPAAATREDSIFVYKYLSVIYAADPKTKIKAESFMVQLLKLMPTIELIDLYISDNIQAIFKNVKADYMNQQKYMQGHDQYGQSKTPKQPGNGTSNGKSTAFWWVAGGVGVAAAVGAAYFVFEPKPEAKKTYVPVWQDGNPQ